MIPLAFLASLFVSVLGCSTPQTAPDKPVLKGELKDVPAQGKEKAGIAFEGTTNLPDGTFLNAYLFYDRVDEGREIAKDTPEVKAGKFTAEFSPFDRKNLSGKYVARMRFNPALQGQAMPFQAAKADFSFQIGTDADKER